MVAPPVTVIVVVFLQPVVPSVNVSVAVPPHTPVISPVLSMVATEGLLLAHVPPELGVT